MSYGKGDVVRVIKGKSAGASGEVFWAGRTKYGKDRYGIKTDDGEEIWVAAYEVAPPAAPAAAPAAPAPVAAPAVDGDLAARVADLEAKVRVLTLAVAALSNMALPGPVATAPAAPAAGSEAA